MAQPFSALGISKKLKQLALFDQAQSTGATITIPANSPENSIAILAQFSVNTGTTTIPTLVTPTGFTNIAGLGDTGSFNTSPDSGDRGFRAAVSYKILDADDEGDSLTGMDATFDKKVLLVFEGVNFTPTGLTAQDADSEAVWNSNTAADTILSAAGLAPLIAMGFAEQAGGIVSVTTDLAASSTAADSLKLYWSIYNQGVSRIDHSFDVGAVGGTSWCASCYFEISG